ncbi:MAG: VCBS repeat-containing protein [Bacteroidales bacterium]|nr:VCBS repeat-containing protein [Bacteroidales bacterium]
MNSSGVGTGTIDWDNDGNYDLLITGWEPEIGTQTGWLFKGDGAGNFTEVGRIPGASETVMIFNDWNNDDVLDVLVSGYSGDPMWYAEEERGRTASVYFNTNTATPNERPSSPTNLTSTPASDNVTLSWDAATDSKPIQMH